MKNEYGSSRVWEPLIKSKLKARRVERQLLRWIRPWLCHRMRRLQVNAGEVAIEKLTKFFTKYLENENNPKATHVLDHHGGEVTSNKLETDVTCITSSDCPWYRKSHGVYMCWIMTFLLLCRSVCKQPVNQVHVYRITLKLHNTK